MTNESPCNNYVIDNYICDDAGETKGQCANCGWTEEEHTALLEGEND